MKKFFLSLTIVATLISAVGFCQDDAASFSDEVASVQEVDARQDRENKIMKLQNELMALEAERANELSSNGYSRLDGSPVTAPRMMQQPMIQQPMVTAQPNQSYAMPQQHFVAPQNNYIAPQPNYAAPAYQAYSQNYAAPYNQVAPAPVFQPPMMAAPMVQAPIAYQQFTPLPAPMPISINPHPQPIPAAAYLPPVTFAPAMAPIFGAPQIIAAPAKKKGCGLFGCGR